MTDILKIDAFHPDPSLINTAVDILLQGGIIAYPTETFYALGADCLNEKAIDQIFDIKGRAFNSPIALIGGSDQDLSVITDRIPETAKYLMKAFWPGPLTLIFHASRRIKPRLTGGSGKIGLRISSNPLALALAKALGRPITATSANLSGNRESVTAADVLEQLDNQVTGIIDGGQTPGGKGSTMLDLTAKPPVVVRAGAIPTAEITKVLESMTFCPGWPDNS
jgi:L-threonylcarbamoyladenylate synthase